MKENSRVTISDIAKKCGVSAQTVSRAFNGSSYVKEEKKKLIFDVAKKMNYIPNTTAKFFRTGKSKRIAVVFDTLKNLYFSIMIDYLNAEVKKHGYTIDTIFVDEHLLTKDIYIQIISKGDDGIISLLECTDDIDELIEKYNIPVLVAGRTNKSNKISYIACDDYKGGELAAKSLIEKGCNNFLYLTEVKDMECSDTRYLGFKEYLHKHNKKCSMEVCYNDIEGTLDRLLSNNYDFDGVFLFNDMIAYVVKNYLGKKTSEKIHLVGYDGLFQDIPILGHLKSIAIDKVEFAKEIINSTINLITKQNKRIIKKKIQPSIVE